MTTYYGVEETKSAIRSTVARALALALITGIDQAREEGHELSQVQQVDMATMSVMAYSEALEACESEDALARALALHGREGLRRVGG